MKDVKFEVGDSVVIIAAQSGANAHKYKDGDSGTVSIVFDDNDCYTWCYVDFVDEDGEVQTEDVYFREMKKVDEVSIKTTPTFKIGDKVVFLQIFLGKWYD